MLATVWTWKEKQVSFWNNPHNNNHLSYPQWERPAYQPPTPPWLVNWTTSFLSHISITLKRLTHTSCHTQHNAGTYPHHSITHSYIYHKATTDSHHFCHVSGSNTWPTSFLSHIRHNWPTPSVTPQWWLAHLISATRITQGLMDITLPVCHTYHIDTTDRHHCHTETPDPHHSVGHTYHIDTTDPHRCHTGTPDPHRSATQTQLTHITVSVTQQCLTYIMPSVMHKPQLWPLLRSDHWPKH